MTHSPYHSGEIALQDLYGVRARALGLARGILPAIPARAFDFVTAQPLAVLGARDAADALWASVVFGAPGFLHPSQDGTELHIALPPADAGTGPDPVLATLQPGAGLGALLIDFDRRTRLRVNGTVTDAAGPGLVIRVAQAYANCPKYIQRRIPLTAAEAPGAGTWRTGRALGPEQQALIAQADTFFIASAHPEGSVDVSHRGGPPGFASLRDGVLRFADYPGNSMFNTLGNLHVNPRVGLAFVDFERGLQLHLTGTTCLDLHPSESGAPGDTGRHVEVTPARWIMGPIGTPMRWQLREPSPFTPPAS